MKFTEHLAKIFQNCGVTQQEVAKQTGLSRQTISRWLNGESEPDRGKIVALANFLQLPPAYVMFGNDGSFTPEEIDPETISIPFINIESSNKYFQPSKAIRSMRVEKSWIQSKTAVSDFNALRLINVEGDSMRPTFARGDCLIIDTSVKAFTIAGVYLVKIRGQMFIKRVQKTFDGGYSLTSDNDTYPPINLPAANAHEVQFIGKCIITCNSRGI